MHGIGRKRRRGGARSAPPTSISVIQTLQIDGNCSPSVQPQDRAGALARMIGDHIAPIEKNKIAREIVRRALADLPAHQRALLTLICVDGMTYKQTAELLDIPIDNVAERVARARQALDEQIALRSPPDLGHRTIPLGLARADTEGGGHSC
jgi:DNA-directed RNA polymerase specialized sigma24 family protein